MLSIPQYTPEQRKEKRETSDRLHEYYSKNGLGCFVPLAEASGINICVLHEMMQADPFPYETWAKVKRGLDKISPTPAPSRQSSHKTTPKKE